MKHLLNGAAIAAALAIAAPVWAQSPTGGNAMGTPGPNPGGPGLTPYSGGAPPAPPAMHRPMHPAHHTAAMHAHHKRMARGAGLTGDTTAQLNREELARINSGNMSNPSAPPGPPPPSSGRMPGPKTSGGRNIPPTQ